MPERWIQDQRWSPVADRRLGSTATHRIQKSLIWVPMENTD